jgi:hypothetical protein
LAQWFVDNPLKSEATLQSSFLRITSSRSGG